MDEMTFTLHNPLTEEEWDIIEDVDFEHTNSITFHTKHGKEVEFVKLKTGRWQRVSAIKYRTTISHIYTCDKCGETARYASNFCPNCGARMDGEA